MRTPDAAVGFQCWKMNGLFLQLHMGQLQGCQDPGTPWVSMAPLGGQEEEEEDYDVTTGSHAPHKLPGMPDSDLYQEAQAAAGLHPHQANSPQLPGACSSQGFPWQSVLCAPARPREP